MTDIDLDAIEAANAERRERKTNAVACAWQSDDIWASHYADDDAPEVIAALVAALRESEHGRAAAEAERQASEIISLTFERDLFVSELRSLRDEHSQLANAIREHRAQKADDRCVEDDDRLYEALGDGIKCDRRVGRKTEMLANCARFIDRRCEGGGWPSYAELETELAAMKARAEAAEAERDNLLAIVRIDGGRAEGGMNP